MLSECLSTLNKPCIFPFTYKSVIHEECTHVGSENGAAWCATEVRMSGNNLHFIHTLSRLTRKERWLRTRGKTVRPAVLLSYKLRMYFI